MAQDTKTHGDRISESHISPYSRLPLLVRSLPDLVSHAPAIAPMLQRICGVLDTLLLHLAIRFGPKKLWLVEPLIDALMVTMIKLTSDRP
jgi:hypothetical protein